MIITLDALVSVVSRLFLAAVIAMAVSSCEKSAKEKSTTETSPPSPELSASSPAENPVPVPESAPLPETPSPEASKHTLLDVIENESGNTITVSGCLSSTYQARDLFDGLRRAFPEVEVVDKLEVNPTVPEVVWGNRINSLMIPFLQNVNNAHFNYHKGVTTLEGTVGKKQAINQLGNMTVYVMEAADSQGIKNRLKVKSE